MDALVLKFISLGRMTGIILTMTVVASIIILLYLLAKKVGKDMPKVFRYMIFAAVIFRLLCPFTIDLPVSVMPEFLNDGKWVNRISDIDMIYDETVIDEAPRLWFDSVKTQQGYEYHTRTQQMTPAIKVGDVIFPLLLLVWMIGVILTLVKGFKKRQFCMNGTGVQKVFLFLAWVGYIVHWFNPLVHIFVKAMKEDIDRTKQEGYIENKSPLSLVKGAVIALVVIVVAFVGKNSVVKSFETNVSFDKAGFTGSISYEKDKAFEISVKNETEQEVMLSPSVYLFRFENGQYKQMEFELPSNYTVLPYIQNIPGGESSDAFHLDFYRSLKLQEGKYMLVIPVLSGGQTIDALEAEFEIH